MKDKKHPITRALKNIDYFSRGSIGPDLTVSGDNVNLTVDELILKALLNLTMEGLNLTAISEQELRNQIGNKLREAGVNEEALTSFFNHFEGKNLKQCKNTVNNMHALKASGIPTIELFDILLVQNDAQSTDAQEAVKSKQKSGITLPMDPHFFSTVYSDIPGAVRSDNDDFVDLLNKFLDASIPTEFSNNTKIQHIRNQALENAKSYLRLRNEAKTFSVIKYAHKHKTTFPCVTFTEAELKKLQKKIMGDEIIDLNNCNDLNFSFNCYHCAAVDHDEQGPYRTTDFDMNSEIGNLNTLRLTLRRGPEESERHFIATHCHSSKRGHRYLIPCFQCINSKTYGLAFTCCLQCWYNTFKPSVSAQF